MADDAAPLTPLLLRTYQDSDAPETWRVFHDAVHGTAIRDYTPEQVQAWAPDTTDLATWGQVRASSHTWVATLDGRVVGFSDYTDDGLLDMLFVHPDAAGRGVASALLTRVLTQAAAAGLSRLHTHASLTARPVFERFGFTVDKAQQVHRRGQTLRNFHMTIQLVGETV